MELEEELQKALAELRKEKERKFNQSVDLIINLQKFDVKKNLLNFFVSVPFEIKKKKICGFLESKNKDITTITPSEFGKYSDKKDLRKLVKEFDFFVAQANLMPRVATTFGRVLGPAGKMPSPQLGIIPSVDEKTIKSTIDKVNKSIKVRVKEPSIKLCVGKQNMDNKEIIENSIAVYNAVVKAMPRDKDNVKNIEIKFTMNKPKKIKIR